MWLWSQAIWRRKKSWTSWRSTRKTWNIRKPRRLKLGRCLGWRTVKSIKSKFIVSLNLLLITNLTIGKGRERKVSLKVSKKLTRNSLRVSRRLREVSRDWTALCENCSKSKVIFCIFIRKLKNNLQEGQWCLWSQCWGTSYLFVPCRSSRCWINEEKKLWKFSTCLKCAVIILSLGPIFSIFQIFPQVYVAKWCYGRSGHAQG